MTSPPAQRVITGNLAIVAPEWGLPYAAEVPDQPFDPSTPSVNHDRSGLWAPDPLDEFRIEVREPREHAATEPAIEFVGMLPEGSQLEIPHGNPLSVAVAAHPKAVAVAPNPVAIAVAPYVSALKDRRTLWSFASGAVFGAVVCVILVSTLRTSASPPSEPSSDRPAPLSSASSAPAPVSAAVTEKLQASRSLPVSDQRPVVENVSTSPTLTVKRQAVRQVPVPSPPTQARSGAFVGSLRIDSTPQGAQVFINRQSAGVTPLIVPTLGAGSHAVRVEAEGYLSWSSAIRVIADRQTSIHTALTPLDASVPR